MSDTKNAYTRLVKGTAVYMFGNMTSKVLQMLILPIVTASLLTSEYGYYDLVVTTISLITPIITFQMIEGMFRYMFNASETERKATVSTVTVFLLCGFIFLGSIIFVFQLAKPTLEYPLLIYLNYVSSIVFNYSQKLSRCQQKNKQFAISGVINTIVMLSCQALTLLVFKMGIDGMLMANFLSYICASIYLAFHINMREWMSLKAVSKKSFISIFKFSAPLIPNSICWWLVASSDKYVIAYFMGNAANGIYSIASKFSQLLTFVTSVFQLAWQESAIMEENSENRDKFYSDTFNTYMKLLMGAYLCILPFVRLAMPFLVDASYQMGYLYNPILLLGAVFSAFSQFYGSAYLVFKKTRGAFSTTIVAAIINFIISAGTIKWIGLFAPALGTTIAFLVQWIMRLYQLKECFRVKVDLKTLTLLSICTAIFIALYYQNNTYIHMMTFMIGVFVFFAVNRRIIFTIISKVKLKL